MVKHFSGFQTGICSSKHQRIVFKNCFLELFFKTFTNQGLYL